jgi:hypothetical protein
MQHRGVQLQPRAQLGSLWRSTIAPFNGFLTANQLSTFTVYPGGLIPTPAAAAPAAVTAPANVNDFDDSDESSWIFW